jgi:hypothetical protein
MAAIPLLARALYRAEEKKRNEEAIYSSSVASLLVLKFARSCSFALFWILANACA